MKKLRNGNSPACRPHLWLAGCTAAAQERNWQRRMMTAKSLCLSGGRRSSSMFLCFCVHVPEAGWWCGRTGWCSWPLDRWTAWGKTSRGSLPSTSMQAWCHPRTLRKIPGSDPQRQIHGGGDERKQKVSAAETGFAVLFHFPYYELKPDLLGINLQGCWYINWKFCFQVQINLECCLCTVVKGEKLCSRVERKPQTKPQAHTYFYRRKTPDASSQSYYVLEQCVCPILPCISLLWQHVSSLSVERRQRTRELRVMASTTALKTLTGSRSSVVPLSTIALSMLYWKKERKSGVQ